MSPDAENLDALPDVPVHPQHLERIAETFDREHPKLLRWLLRKAPRQDAEDILGEAFTQVQAWPASLSPLCNDLPMTGSSSTTRMSIATSYSDTLSLPRYTIPLTIARQLAGAGNALPPACGEATTRDPHACT